MMSIYEANDLIGFLKRKKVPFVIKRTERSISVVPIDITKKGKFYRANGVIIGGNLVPDIERLNNSEFLIKMPILDVK